MNMTSAAAAEAANVTVATIRTWCRIGAVAARKVAGQWVIDAASLARRIEIGSARPTIVNIWGACGHITTAPAFTAAVYERHDTCRPCASANAMATAVESRAARDAERAERRRRANASRRARCECASGRYGGVCTC